MHSSLGPTTAKAVSRPQVFIALMGGTGTGKTTFVNLAGGSQFLVENGLESCTNHVQPHQFVLDDHDVTLIDMPGFDDTNKSDTDIFTMIADFLVAEYRENKSLTGIIFFHRISDVKMGGTSKRNFTMFQKLCGADAFTNVAIVTTRWDQVIESVGLGRLAELKAKPQLFKPVLDGGAEIFRHDRSYDSARSILRHLIGKTSKPLLIQHEMVIEGKELSKTAAGQELQQEIMQQVDRHQREIAELIKEIEQSRDASAPKELVEDCQALRDRMAHYQAEAGKLVAPSIASAAELLAAEISPEISSKSMFISTANDALRAQTSSNLTILGDGDRTVEAERGDQLGNQERLDEHQHSRTSDRVRLENVDGHRSWGRKILRPFEYVFCSCLSCSDLG